MDVSYLLAASGGSRRRARGGWSQSDCCTWTHRGELGPGRRRFSDHRPACGRHRARARDSISPQFEGPRMTPALLLARDFIIYWVKVSLAPVEFTYDMIEAELRRRGIDP